MRKVQADRQRGIGLRNMRERMEGLGGTLKIYSESHGTEVQASLKTFPDSTHLKTHDYATDDLPHSGG